MRPYTPVVIFSAKGIRCFMGFPAASSMAAPVTGSTSFTYEGTNSEELMMMKSMNRITLPGEILWYRV